MFKYSAYITTWGNNRLYQHVIANGKTIKGMISDLKRYVSKMGKHSPYSDSIVVYLWCIDSGVYDRRALSDYK